MGTKGFDSVEGHGVVVSRRHLVSGRSGLERHLVVVVEGGRPLEVVVAGRRVEKALSLQWLSGQDVLRMVLWKKYIER